MRSHPPNTAEICWPPRWMVMRHSGARLGGLLQVAGLGDLDAVDREQDVAALEAELLGQRAVGNVDHDHALGRGVEPQLIGQRRREVGHLGAAERRARLDQDFIARQLRRGLERDRELALLAAAHHAEIDLAAERMRHEAVIEGVRIVDRLPADRDDDVAGLQPRPRRRAFVGDAGDDHARRPLQVELAATIPASAPAAWRRATAA